MGDRQAQEFWDNMWYWENYEKYPAENRDDPHLVIILGGQVDQAINSGQEPDPELFQRFDACVGRVLERFNVRFPRTGADVDMAEFKNWLAFGLNPNMRGHDGTPTPIIDANSLVIFRRFVGYALAYCDRHQLSDLRNLWNEIAQVAQQVDEEHQGARRPSRFEVPVA
jgi:hypothetical protein